MHLKKKPYLVIPVKSSPKAMSSQYTLSENTC